MILWMNGTFGVGKTTTATAVCKQSKDWRLFDPEHVGFLLMDNLKGIDFADFQDLPPWRSLVPVVMREIQEFTGDNLLAVQSVMNQGYWEELWAGVSENGESIFHVVLDCEESTLRERIHADQVEVDAKDWRLEHIEAFQNARPWMTASADLIVDTSAVSVEAVAATILEAVMADG